MILDFLIYTKHSIYQITIAYTFICFLAICISTIKYPRTYLVYTRRHLIYPLPPVLHMPREEKYKIDDACSLINQRMYQYFDE
jgi:hypothetical protein